ncbi:MAG: magnesium transporter CorA family protein [Xanthobacteraceae bacterium]|uniref:magnesium transporter CorA family protein n=1 Tax=Pseudolabrys sp. TaxID=1960880 RepID=UPI003D137563
MLSVYVPNGTSLERVAVEPGAPLPDSAIWVDLISPTVPEDKTVEDLLGVAIPTREEMQEIEVSSRLYVENGGRYMTATLMCQSDTASPKTTPVTFILAKHRLVTVRYDEPRPFVIIEHKLARSCPAGIKGEQVLMDLLDAIIDRTADILERIGAEVDQISHTIFEPDEDVEQPPYDDILKALGRKGDLTSKVRESQVSIARLLLFLSNEAENMRWAKDTRAQLKTMVRDVGSLSDHATYISNKVTFLLDALLGIVSIQQNDIIKIFSIAAVVFMPPTLVASIYGMNFHKNMIELEWDYGYPFALVLMVLAAVVPYLIFKWKKWI